MKPVKTLGLSINPKGADFSLLVGKKSDEAGNKRVSKAVMMMPMAEIEEDPDQPRKADNTGFSQESLEELAEAIRERGVKTPISVRETQNGKYIINHGARRFRASRIAGLKTIPAFIDNEYLSYDQVQENVQRMDLSADEVADFIGRQLDAGSNKTEIARMLGKSNAYVQQHAALLDLPDILADAWHSHRITDLTVLNDLVRIHNKNRKIVAECLEQESGEITRSVVRELKSFLAGSVAEKERNVQAKDAQTDVSELAEPEESAAEAVAEVADAEVLDPGRESTREKKVHFKWKNVLLTVEYAGRSGRLILDRAQEAGRAWIQYSDGEIAQVAVGDVRLTGVIGLVEG